MPRSDQHISNYENEILELKTQGMTLRETGTKLGFTKDFLYLSIIRDLYDNSIIAYKMAKEQSIKLVLDTIKSDEKRKCYCGGAYVDFLYLKYADVFQVYCLLFF